VSDAGRWLQAARALDDWMRARNFAGHDPFDLLASPLVRRLCFGLRWPAVAWTQLGKRSPVQLRGVLRVPRQRNPKGIGLVLAAYVRLLRATGDAAYLARAADLVAWLSAVARREYGGAGWGYPFPWANRAFQVPAHTPASVPTAFIGHALFDAAQAGIPGARELAFDAAAFLAAALPRLPAPDGSFCFAYTPLDRRGVHNASILAASVLARAAAAGGAGEWAEAAAAAARHTLAAQAPDGSWPYGTGRRDGWVDSFHTGYILLALAELRRSLSTPAPGAPALEDAIARGAAYWRRAFLVGPAVAFHPGAAYPIETHAVAHAILTLLALPEHFPDGRAQAERLGEWCLREARDPAGHFHYRHGRRIRNRLPYMRWVQAWMLRALAELAAFAAGVPAPGGAGGATATPAPPPPPAGEPAAIPAVRGDR